MNLTTTFAKLHDARACKEGYAKLARHLGGVDKYGKETPIPLGVILDSNGLDDTIWCLRCTNEPSAAESAWAARAAWAAAESAARSAAESAFTKTLQQMLDTWEVEQ